MVATIESALAWFRTTPAGRQAERAVEQQHARREAAAALKSAEARLESEGLPLAKEITEAEQSLDAWELAHALERLERSRVIWAQRSKLASLQSACDAPRGTLLRTAPEAIGDFLREIAAIEEKTRRSIVTQYSRDYQDKGAFFERVPTTRTNRPAVIARLASCRKARERVESLRFVVFELDALSAELDKIRATIPSESTLESMTTILT